MNSLTPRAPATAEAPYSYEAEWAVLGMALYQPQGVDSADAEGLTPDHFFEPLHARLWTAVREVMRSGELVEPLILAQRFASDPAFVELGGVRYLADMVDRAPPIASMGGFARNLVDLATKRRLIALGHELIALAMEASQPSDDCLRAAHDGLKAVEEGAAIASTTAISAPDAADEAIANIERYMAEGRPRGRMCGLRCVDWRLGGLHPGRLIVVGGRPGMGKTALARAISHGVAVRNPDLDVLFLGLEMGPEEMLQRDLSALTFAAGNGVEYQAMSRAKLSPMELRDVREARRHVPANLIFDDCASGLTHEAVRRKVWSHQRRRPVGLVVIDYLQLMTRPQARGRNDATVLGEVTAALKQTARQLHVPVVLLSQLNRSVESRDDKRPGLADLRESGAIEQDADAVLFPFRPAYYLERSEPAPGDAKRDAWVQALEMERYRLDVITAKQRQGRCGTDRQAYWPQYDHIEDAADEAQENSYSRARA